MLACDSYSEYAVHEEKQNPVSSSFIFNLHFIKQSDLEKIRHLFMQLLFSSIQTSRCNPLIYSRDTTQPNNDLLRRFEKAIRK